MHKADLADALRQRQYVCGEVPVALIDSVSDDQMIDAYVTDCQLKAGSFQPSAFSHGFVCRPGSALADN